MDNNYYGNICYCRKCNGIVHTIKKGDTLYLLSRYYNVPIGEIMNANRNLNIYNLQIGQEICIPIRRSDMMNDTINGSPMPEVRYSSENEMPVNPSNIRNSSNVMNSAGTRNSSDAMNSSNAMNSPNTRNSSDTMNSPNAMNPSDTMDSSGAINSLNPAQVMDTASLSSTEVSENTFDQSISMSALIADKDMTFEKFMELVHKY